MDIWWLHVHVKDLQTSIQLCVWVHTGVTTWGVILTIHSLAVFLCSFTHMLYIQIQTPDRTTDHAFTCVDGQHCAIVECFEPFLQLHWFQRRHSTLIECMRTQLFSYTFSLIFSASLKMPGEAEITFPIMTVLDELCFLTLLPAGFGTWLLKYLRDTYDSFCVCLVFMLTSSRNQSLYSFIPQWLN